MSLWLNDHPKRRKAIMTVILVAFVFQIALTPQGAAAILGAGDVVTDPMSMWQRAAQWLKEGYKYVVEKGLKVAAWKAFQTAVQRFLGRIAYDTAVWIGSGDKGKKPLLYTKGWKQYIEDAGDAAAGDFIETLADEWSGQADRKKESIELQRDLAYQDALFNNRECSRYGPGSPEYSQDRPAIAGSTLPDPPNTVPDTFDTSCASIATERAKVRKALDEINTNIARTAPFLAAICTPPDGIQLKIALGLGTPTSPKAAKCTFSQMRENWEQAVEDPGFLDKFSLSFNPAQSDLGVALDLQSNLLIEQDKRQLNETLTRSADGAFKSVTSGVSGMIQTPARMIDNQARKAIDKAFDASTEQPPPGLLEGVATIFTNTLVSSLADRMKRGFWTLRDVSDKKKSANLGGLGGRPGTPELEQYFSSLKTVALQPNTNFDIVSQFQQCPAELRQQVSTYACVLDGNFADAIRGRGGRGLMTVREAMEEGLLHGNWNFGYDDPAQNREPAYNSGYAYSSMVKLRRFRIIPVGWEFAAQYIRTRNQPYTLQHVTDCYEDPKDQTNRTFPAECREDGDKNGKKDGKIDGEDLNPFWHLVDPNWVLKAPQTNCRAWGAGQQVHKDTGQRLEYCADVRDCVVENENGTCAAEWYCTREKNVWRFAGDKCDAQYDTCRTVSHDDTGEDLSALQNSWNKAGCTAQTAGCTAHAVRTYDAAKKEWVNATANNVIREERFLTKQAATCTERAVGCRAFIRPTDGVNLVPNGTFELGIEGELPTGWGPRGSVFTKSLPIAQRGQSATLAKDFAGLLKTTNQQVTVATSILGILPERTYTVSAWAYVTKAPTSFGNIGVRVTQKQGTIASALLNTTKLNQWQEVRFGAPVGLGDIEEPKILLIADSGAEVFWDDVIVAEGSRGGAQSYGEGGMTYLRWTDDAKKTLSCTKDEVGCALYTPENGDPARAGVTSAANACPSECVGYAMFDQQTPKNLFDIERRGLSFIPSTARTCQAEDVGCDEFTNLDEVAKGGEGLTYFTEIRQCQKPAPASSDCAPFYTYEGSATSGAQLQTYSLKAGATGNPATTDGSGDCVRILDPKDLRYNPNCRDFINAQGKHSFRDITKTITCSNNCYPYRKTLSNQQQCNATSGEWGGNACTYDVIPSEGKQCAKQARGCRAYIGNTGHVLKTVAREDFERGKPKAWQTDGEVRTEAPQPGGHSLAVNAGKSTEWTLDAGTFVQGAQYTVTFLVKKQNPDPAVPLTLTLQASGIGATQTFTKQITATGWNAMIPPLGPIVVTQQGNATWKLTFSGSHGFYLDDVYVRRTNDQYYRIKDTWVTPATCTAAAIGCQAYRDTKGSRLTFSAFAKSCAFDKVGCAAYIDTQNSTSPFSEVWNLGGDKQCVGGSVPGKVCQGPADCTGGGVCRDRDLVKTEEDALVYLINRSDYACNEEERGCAALETQVAGRGGRLEPQTIFLRDDPDQYGSTLCSTTSEGCAIYNGEGGPYYIHDPKEKICEYQRIPGSKDFGWFKKGNQNAAAPDCEDGWAKLCPREQSRCTKFIDPMDTNKLYPQGYPYYAIKNESLDTGSCGTTVDRRRGCVLIQDTSNTNATYAAAPTNDGSDSPESQCVNPASDRVVPLNIASKPNEQTLEFSLLKTFAAMSMPKIVDYGSYMVEFEAKPRRLQGQAGSAEVRVDLEREAPGATTTTSSSTPTPGVPTITPVNLIPNGGFEDGNVGQMPSNWTDRSTNVFTKVAIPAPRGSGAAANNFSGRLDASAQQGRALTRFTNVTPQKEYTMTAWAYIQTAPVNGVVEARFVQEQAGRRTTVRFANFDTTKLNEWQVVTFNATTGAGQIDEVSPELIVGDGGVVFWDDISITLAQVSQPGGGTGGGTTTVRSGTGGVIRVGIAQVQPDGWSRYIVGPVKLQKGDKITGNVVLHAPSDVVMVERVIITLACDANVIMKVDRDRTCGEWVYCKSSVYQRDATSGEYREVCTQLGRCSEADPDRPSECKTPIPTTFTTEKPLTRDLYQSDVTHVGWAGLDYTGLSIPNIYPIESLQQITRSPTKLTYVKKNEGTKCNVDADCKANGDGDLCLTKTCYEDRGIDGSREPLGRKEKACRLYPEETSPLPSFVGEWYDEKPDENPNSKEYTDWARGGTARGETDYYTFLESKKQGFKYSEVCQKGEDCDCSYKKVLYSNGDSRYYGENAKPPFKLLRYEKDQNITDRDDKDYDSLTPSTKKQEDRYVGWRGYCLEADPNPKALIYQGADTKPCFTWWPVDTLQGEIGLFTNYPTSGFEVQNPYYCLASAWQEYRSAYNIKTLSGVKRSSTATTCDPNYTKNFTDSGYAGLTRYKRYRCDPIGGPGWYPFDGRSSPTEVGTERRVCTDIAQIGDATQNTARTSRVSDTPPGAFLIQPPPATTPKIQYGDSQKPFGAIPLSGDPRTTTDYVFVPWPGSVPASYSLCDSPGVWQTCLSTSFDKKELSGTGAQGANILKRLFAKSYGVFAAPVVQITNDGTCTGVCAGGTNPGSICDGDDACNIVTGGSPVSYTCTSNVCMGGANAGTPCAKVTTTSCAAPGACGKDGFCVGGPNDKEVCHEKGQCAVDTRFNLQGTCSNAKIDPITGDTTYECNSGPLDGFACDPKDSESCSINQGAECSSSGTAYTGGTMACAHQGIVAGDLSGRPCVGGPPNQFDCSSPGICATSGTVIESSGTKRNISKPFCSNQPTKTCTDIGKTTGCEGTSGRTLMYTELSPANQKNKWDVSDPTIKKDATLPVIAAALVVNGQSIEGPRNQVTIGGSASGNLVGENGTYHASLRFYAYNENGNQMPLTKIIVDWDDDSKTPPVEGKMQNHKNICRRKGALVCAVGARCANPDPTKPCEHKDIQVNQATITSAACPRDPTTNVIREGTLCTAYTEPLKPAKGGLCYQIETEPAINFGDITEACVDDKDLYTPGYFLFEYDYTKPGTYDDISVTVEDNWGQKQTARYNGTITVRP